MNCIFFSGVIVAHLAGQLYSPIFAKQAQFSTQMSVSGPSAGTGKSLMQTIGMLMFYGEAQPTTTTMTEATFYDMLEEGNIYGKELFFIAEKVVFHQRSSSTSDRLQSKAVVHQLSFIKSLPPSKIETFFPCQDALEVRTSSTTLGVKKTKLTYWH